MFHFIKKYLFPVFLWTLIFCGSIHAQTAIRTDSELKTGWHTNVHNTDINAFNGFERLSFKEVNWLKIEVPHNWDQYDGYRRLRHGNRHGYAWYRNWFTVNSKKGSKRVFLWFEGVGSYATVWVNGKLAGYHAGGLTSFTLDITNYIYRNGKLNLLAVRADHPANIKDLPWVCGGCSDERGFSEGSQPMGIFRAVHLITTGNIRVEPFGVHVWSDSVENKSAIVHADIEIKNYSKVSVPVIVKNYLKDRNGKTVLFEQNQERINTSQTFQISSVRKIRTPHVWTLADPYLYSFITEIWQNGKMLDRVITKFGIRKISWQIGKNQSHRFLLNDQPVFINGIAEYENLLGGSHSFSHEEINSRIKQIVTAGFNAFRDAHQPHNLYYQTYWDSLGILWWPQFSAHIWYDTPEFRKNFKQLLIEWVKERRNSPSVILWGLQNESKLPKEFAAECETLIHELDPSSITQIKITTCNGGEGTDWDVPQNWTGTYGGNPDQYGEDLKKQLLVGEYGAWRTLDLHRDSTLFQNGKYTEEDMLQLIEKKIEKAEAVKDSICGHFFWLYNSHDNPGRIQGGEAMREIDRIGPVNYKGLFTSWGEAADVYYLFKARYNLKDKAPIVYIASHTWPDRWIKPGIKDSILIYSNCDEVELFNDVNGISLGKQTRRGKSVHFQWDHVFVKYNILYAKGYVNGKVVATDRIALHHLTKAPHFASLYQEKNLSAPKPGLHYIYRVNCGGAEYTDQFKNTWQADRNLTDSHRWGSISWYRKFSGTPFNFASQRSISEPIGNSADWPLFQSFRYGREQLKYHFPVPEGDYIAELYFIEPWLGRTQENAAGLRLFDVAINGKTILKNLDIWKEAGYCKVLKKEIKLHCKGGAIDISFPHIAAGQALIAAIAIGSLNKTVMAAPASDALLASKNDAINTAYTIEEWMNTGDYQFAQSSITFSSLPSKLYGATWIRFHSSDTGYLGQAVSLKVSDHTDVFIGIDNSCKRLPAFLANFMDTKSTISSDDGRIYSLYRKRWDINGIFQIRKDQADCRYIIAAIPVSSIEPAYDIKNPVNFPAGDAIIAGAGINKENFEGRTVLHFNRETGDTANIVFETGVADEYLLNLKYANTNPKVMRCKIQLLDEAGHLIKEDQIDFGQTRQGKWNVYEGSTGSMINAGKYYYRIISEDAGGLFISGLEVR